HPPKLADNIQHASQAARSAIRQINFNPQRSPNVRHGPQTVRFSVRRLWRRSGLEVRSHLKLNFAYKPETQQVSALECELTFRAQMSTADFY
ncbi:MAG: hypothetical protein VX601_01855, partial [Pseudomonadota bacterium]|nr:hypothetical protein [Pseudomonadota bacterium]